MWPVPPPFSEPIALKTGTRFATGKLTYRSFCGEQWIIRRTFEKLKFCPLL
jgi:hypothetical protein